MDKEQIISTIKTKLGQTSLSDRTLTEYVTNVMPTEGTEPDEAFFTMHTNILKSLSGNFSHDVAEKVEDFKKNYKPEGQQQQSQQQQQQQQNQDDPHLKELEELKKQMAAIIEESNNAKKSKAVGELRNAVLGKADELKVSNKALWNDAVNMVAVEDGFTTEQLLAKSKELYESKLKAYVGDGATPYGGANQYGSSEQGKKDLDDYFAKKALEGKFPSAQ